MKIGFPVKDFPKSLRYLEHFPIMRAIMAQGSLLFRATYGYFRRV